MPVPIPPLEEQSELLRVIADREESMDAVESELDPARFLRIHRSYIVNRAHVRNARYSGNNEFIFSMANNERIVSGRSYKDQIARALQEAAV